MAIIAPKYESAIEEGIVRLLTRAENSRGLSLQNIKPRVLAATEKYLFIDGKEPEKGDVSDFIDSLYADDLCLIIACEQGSEDAWGALVQQFDSTVKSAAYKFARNKEDAEDLAGSIWAELYGLRTDSKGNKKSKLSYYSGKGSLGGWLRAVTNQLAIDQFRQMRRLVQTEDDREFENLALDANERNGSDILRGVETPEEILSDDSTSADFVSAITKVIDKLSDDDRLLIKLYYFDNLKLKEIAEMFGYHEATASRKIVRVQDSIRTEIEVELKNRHGWSKSEVERYLSETAEKTGMNIEALFSLLLMIVLVQEILM
ncbi:MAG: sigma-70 family RNA polymerase sigma factor [Pyrinomonadaceae bacterium]